MTRRATHPGRAVAEVVAAATLFGTTGTAAHFAPASASPGSIGAARVVIGGAGLLAVLPWLDGNRRRAIGLWRSPWGLTAGVMTAVYQLAFFAGVARAGVALGALVAIGSGPVLVGILSWIVLRERPRRAWWISTALCVVGLVLLTLDGASQPTVELLGVALAFLASCGYAVYTVAAKHMMNSGTPAVEAMASAFSLGAVLLLPVLLFTRPTWLAEPSGLAVALWLGLATTTLAYVLFGRGLRVLDAGPAATLVLAEPVVATLLGVLLLGETIGVMGWVGAGLVVIGLGLLGTTAVRHGPDAAIIEEMLP